MYTQHIAYIHTDILFSTVLWYCSVKNKLWFGTYLVAQYKCTYELAWLARPLFTSMSIHCPFNEYVNVKLNLPNLSKGNYCIVTFN